MIDVYGSFVGIGTVVVGEAELGVGLDGRDEDGVVIGDCMVWLVLGGGGGGGETESLFLKSMMASCLSYSAAQQLKKGFFF